MTLLPLLAATVAGFAAFSSPAGSGAARWNVANIPITIQQDGSADIADGSDVAAIRSALATWNAATTGALALQEAGTTSSRSYGYDGVNRITFLESGWPGGADGALGTTIPHISNGSFVDADILLNGTDGPWTTNGNPMGIDVQSVATHEVGHLLGLWHAFHEDTVMYTGSRGGMTFRRSLTADDARGAFYVSRNNPTCSSDLDCPLLVNRQGGTNQRLHCVANSCQSGAVGYGLECVNSADCQSGMCLRDAWASSAYDPGACTTACSPSSPCPNGDACSDVGSGVMRCAPGRGCLEDADCGGGANDRCLYTFGGKFDCRRLCQRDSNCQAPARCIDLGYGAGVCEQPGSLPNGSPCLHALQCQGLACQGTAGDLRCATAPPREDGGSAPDVPYFPDAHVDGVDAGAPGPDAGRVEPADAGGEPVFDDTELSKSPYRCACDAPGSRWAAGVLLALTASRRVRRVRP